MGAFSEQFKLSKRIRQADFGRKETREYWMAWANGVIDRASRVDKFEVKQEDQVLEVGSFEESQLNK